MIALHMGVGGRKVYTDLKHRLAPEISIQETGGTSGFMQKVQVKPNDVAVQ